MTLLFCGFVSSRPSPTNDVDDTYDRLSEMTLEQSGVIEDLDLASEEMPDDFDVFVVGKFSEADEAQALIETLLKRKVYIYKEDGDFQYWTMEDDRFYMARYGEIIFVTNAADNRDAAVARLKAGSGGFVVDKAKVGESNLGYVFVSGGKQSARFHRFSN